MSKKIGMNVALGLNTGGFSQGLNKAKLDMDKFSKDIKRQNELASKFGAGGLGRGFGIAGGVLEGLSMGGVAGGLTGVVAGVAGLTMVMKSMLAMLQSVSTASLKARQTMADLEASKDVAGKITAVTPLAAKAPTAMVTDVNVMAEQFASNFAPRAGDTIADVLVSRLAVEAPNIAESLLGEMAGIAKDLAIGRSTGDIAKRLELAAMSPTSFNVLKPNLANELQRARQAQGSTVGDLLMGVTPQGRAVQLLTSIEQALRGN